MKLLPIAKRRPSPAATALPQLFARQSTDCSSGAFYRCALNDFAGCCSVDPCALDDGCPDDENEPDEDEPDEDEKEEPSSSEREKTTSSTTHEEKTTTVAKTRTATATVTLTNDNGDVTSVVTRVETGVSLPTNLAETDGNNPDSSSDSSDDSGGLSAGAIAGIAVGIAALLLLLAALLFYRRRRRRAAAQATHEAYPAHTPTDEKFLSAATTPAGFAGKFGSRAPTPSTPGMSDGNGRYSYVSSMTASPPPGAAGFPRGAGEVPHPGIAQLDAEPASRIAEMDGGAARPSELPASPIGGAGAPARGLGLGSARQGQGQGQGQGGQLPTVTEVEPGLRGTLNPTEGERSQQTYVTSWSEFGGKQAGGNGGT